MQNRLFGITPLTADFNQDGYPDLIHVNLLGPQKVFISKGGSANHLKIKLANTVESIGAKVTVVLANGDTRHKTFVIGEGLCSDQTHILNFGLGFQQATDVSVEYLNGQVSNTTGTFVNQMLSL